MCQILWFMVGYTCLQVCKSVSMLRKVKVGHVLGQGYSDCDTGCVFDTIGADGMAWWWHKQCTPTAWRHSCFSQGQLTLCQLPAFSTDFFKSVWYTHSSCALLCIIHTLWVPPPQTVAFRICPGILLYTTSAMQLLLSRISYVCCVGGEGETKCGECFLKMVGGVCNSWNYNSKHRRRNWIWLWSN